jgi:sporulation protein YlmC with PRC-barrel domain
MNRSLICSLGLLALSLGVLGRLAANDDEPRERGVRVDVDVNRGDADIDADADVKLSDELPANLARATDVDGINVYGKDGKDLGEIKDLVVDLNTGRVRYVVVSMGGFLGIGDKYFAVPWQALHAKHTEDHEHHFVINIETDRLKDAPGFNQDKWPNFADRNFGMEIDKFYGVERRTGFRPGEREHRRDSRHRDEDRNRDRTDDTRDNDANTNPNP